MRYIAYTDKPIFHVPSTNIKGSKIKYCSCQLYNEDPRLAEMELRESMEMALDD
jgi:hypothetical protein